MSEEEQVNSVDAHAHSGAGAESGDSGAAEAAAAGPTPSPEQTTWGVGPWEGPWPDGAGTDPNSPFDVELLEVK